MSYGELDTLSTGRFGAWLQSRGLEAGSESGDHAAQRTAVPGHDVRRAACGLHLSVNVNPLYTARELEHQLKDSGATAIVILENFAATLEQVIDRTAVKHVVVASMGDLLGGSCMASGSPSRSGTWRRWCRPTSCRWMTGGPGLHALFRRDCGGPRPHVGRRPEHARLDRLPAVHRWDDGSVEGCGTHASEHRRRDTPAWTWFTPALARAGDLSKVNSIAALPLYHIFALTLCLLAIRQGSHLTLITNPRDFDKFIAVLKKRQFHMLPAVNTLFNALLVHPEFKTVDFSTLFVSQAGGMAASEGTARKWFRRRSSLPDDRRLGHERDLCDRDGTIRFRTPPSAAPSACPARHRTRNQGRRRSLASHRRSRRTLHQRSQRHDRLLQPARRNRCCLHAETAACGRAPSQ